MDRESTSGRRSTKTAGDQSIGRALVISTFLAAVAACIVLLPLLGHRALTDWDEGIYAEVSREMLSGSFFVPHWNNQFWFEKPPLMMWITAIFFKLFGMNEFWARAGSAFSGIALVTLIHGWLARRQERFTAWLSTVLLLSTFGFLHVCHVGEMDALLSLGCVLALIGLAEVQQRNTNGWYFFWAGFAMALMTKGAGSIVLVLTLVIFATTSREIWSQGIKPFLLGFVAFLCAVLPWHLYMFHRFGGEFVSNYLGLHVLERATAQIEGHNTAWWYYLKVLLVSALSLILLAFPAIAASFRDPGKKILRVFAIFALVVIGFFTIVQTRLPHYIAPAYPALVVLVAVWWAQPARHFFQTRRSTAARIAFVAIVIATFAICALVTAAPRKRLHAPILADGSVVGDNKESAALVREVFSHTQSTPGPLLFWRQPHLISVATSIFYAQRPVQRVLPETVSPDVPRDKYMFDPEPMSEALGSESRLILLDKSLIPNIPAGYVYTPIKASQTLSLGIIVKTK
jgi:4-amino-4-deoxy-L-arabinose transferase-like glycosyltransferase